MKYIIDCYSGTGSVSKALALMKWTNKYNVVAIDKEHRSPDTPYTTKLTIDTTKINEQGYEAIYNKFPVAILWCSMPCPDFSNNKNNHMFDRNMDRGMGTFLSSILMKDTFLKKNPKLKWFFENPYSPIFKQLCEKYNLPYYVTYYCPYNQVLVAPDGHKYNSFPYQKKTIIATNVKGLNLKQCHNDCKMTINGRHLVSLGWSNIGPHQMSIEKYCQKLNRHGAIPHCWRPASHITTIKLFQVPPLLIVELFHNAGM